MEGGGCYYGWCQCPPGAEIVHGDPYTWCKLKEENGKLFGLSGPVLLGAATVVGLIVFLEVSRRR